MPTYDQSNAQYVRAERLMPAGVSSPVRAFRRVGGTPVFLVSGRGARVRDADGNEYLDFCMAWGPLILGHAHPAVIEAVQRAARDGLAFGACHRHESQLAERVLAAFSYADLVRFVVSGTEAVATAVRLARAATGRRRILKFEGCYHGHVDAMLVRAGSGLVSQGLAGSAGVPEALAAETLVVPLGNPAALEAVFERHGAELAAAIIEPVPANSGLLPQDRKLLVRLRELTAQHGAILIFDEVITGFRFGFHGCDRLFGVTPDLTTLGKIVGGGLPVAAVLGGSALMRQLAPLGPVYQAGTMAGNPVALAAGDATLDVLAQGDCYRRIDELGAYLDQAAQQHPLTARAQLLRFGSLLWPYFDPQGRKPTCTAQISRIAMQRYEESHRSWLDQGLYLPPSAHEVSFLSAAHTRTDVDTLLATLAAH